MNLKIKKLHPAAIIPTYGTEGAACFDLYAFMGEGPAPELNSHMVNHGTPATLRTALAVEVPEGHVMLVYSRSGHGFKSDIRLANCVGVIDSDYRGELMVKLTNDNSDGQSIIIRHGDRIAQAMIIKFNKVTFEVMDELSDTARGEGGFGSTGK